MAVKPQTAASFKEAVVFVDKIGKARKTIEPAFRELSGKLASAMQAKDGPMIELYLKSLGTEVSAITAAMKNVDLALGTLREVETDEDFVATRMADLEKLMKIVSEARGLFTREFAAAKQLENKAEKVLSESEDAEGQALRELARLDHEVDDDRKEMAALYARAEAVNTKCGAAVDAHDVGALKQAQKAFAALSVDVALTLHDILVQRVSEFGKKDALSKDLSAQAQDELKDGVKDMQVKLAGVRAYAEQLRQMLDRIPGLAVADIDLKKAAKVLELDHQDARIAKALAGSSSSWERGLEALSKELKMKKNGKQLLQDLQRAKVL
jgi:hypothetical protein